MLDTGAEFKGFEELWVKYAERWLTEKLSWGPAEPETFAILQGGLSVREVGITLVGKSTWSC